MYSNVVWYVMCNGADSLCRILKDSHVLRIRYRIVCNMESERSGGGERRSGCELQEVRLRLGGERRSAG